MIEQSSARAFTMNRMQHGDRVAEAELEIEKILRKHRVEFAINTHKDGDLILHQEIILVDRRER